jgi:hypothetical protein
VTGGGLEATGATGLLLGFCVGFDAACLEGALAGGIADGVLLRAGTFLEACAASTSSRYRSP